MSKNYHRKILRTTIGHKTTPTNGLVRQVVTLPALHRSHLRLRGFGLAGAAFALELGGDAAPALGLTEGAPEAPALGTARHLQLGGW